MMQRMNAAPSIPGRSRCSSIVLALTVLLGCRGSESRHARAHDDDRSANTPPALELDRPDPSGDRILVWPAPLDSSTAVIPGEKQLKGFSCTKQITGKRPNGSLEISFEPTTPSDVLFRIEFRASQPACNYVGELRLVGGRLNDDALGRAVSYRCRRSPSTVFAVSCGPYLGSDLTVLVRGNGWGRTVSFRIPPNFHANIPAVTECSLPFVNYGDAPEHPPQFNNDELVFDLVECHSTP